MTGDAERVKVPSTLVASAVEYSIVSKSVVVPARARADQSLPIDVATVRETLLYMHDDMKRAPELARVRTALAMALMEIDKVDRGRRTIEAADITRARFFPWTGRR